MVKAVFFDYGDLLFSYLFNKHTLFRAHKLVIQKLNTYDKNLSIENLAKAHDIAIREYKDHRTKTLKEWPMKKIMSRILKYLKINSNGNLSNEIGDIYKLNDHDFYPKEGIINFIKEIKPHYSLNILSNLPHDSALRELADYSLLGNFDNIIFSFEAGYRKPHPRIYKYAVEKSGISRDKMLFLSHDEEEIKGAIKAGIKANLVKNARDIRRVLL